MINRRSLLQTAAGAVLGTVPGIRPTAAQTATLMAMVYLSRRLDATHMEFRNWYIEHHSPDFMSFAKPYLTRYTQDFVEKGHMGGVDFDCITEFGYRSQELREQLVHLVEQPEPKRILDSHPRPGKKPGPNEAHDGPRRYSIDEQLISGAARGFDKPGTFKQAAMLRLKGNQNRDTFNASVRKFAMGVSAATKGAVERVMVDLAVPEPATQKFLFDAVVQLWPKNKADLSKAFANPPADIEVVNILDLVAYEADTGGA